MWSWASHKRKKMRSDIDPKIWGPPAWLFIDSVFKSFPVSASIQDQKWMVDFLTVLGDALPCQQCRFNYKLFSVMNPPSVAGRVQVEAWMDAYKKWSAARR